MRLFALAMVIVLAAGCEEKQDSPEVAQRKADCRRLEAHIFQITPQAQGGLAGLPEVDPRRVEQLVAKLPVEDIEQCAAARPEVIACMQAAADVAALRACIPAKAQ